MEISLLNLGRLLFVPGVIYVKAMLCCILLRQPDNTTVWATSCHLFKFPA